jgi:hypothetical protein
MSYSEIDQADLVSLSGFPAKTMLWLLFLLSCGAALLFLVFYFIAWLLGWPGPFLWFGSTSRMSDIIMATYGVAFSIFLSGALGIPVIKVIASAVRICNVKLKVR